MTKIILSKHALERARSRKMELSLIEKVVANPDKKFDLEENKSKFLKTIDGRRYQVVATYLQKENKWLVISVWVRGEEDQLPFIWILITSPFRLLWWLIKIIWQILAKIAVKK
ncbi:MAG: hypothetical protein UT13_C0001G0626 [Candidatus Pacebacteria bacterium GW2011_GWF2_38_9]|nr:MAG: hypothetical protein US01_C0001G0652 [candidate division TM6 bacterium GW2011_GWF2_28_16]KKQ08690.1 MAG: hypothetical protein US20_C0013G0040 [Candidatus Pacebacteria bacterium GW2011_GWF1_36_5]KKQ88979.1 MAG: hypothetical protein UT13_C0001G0626 [Candidatus Pacebacteria bacterium GW2011_GWF2_38_9]HAZ73154.1 hypothetical protein [Candidatus Paceibacterota bacterium]